VSGTPSTFSLSSIPGTYRSLHIVVSGVLSATNDIYMQYNGDTGNNYTRQYLQGQGSSASAGQSSVGIAQAPACNFNGPGAANVASTCVVDIDLYAGTTFVKMAMARIAEVQGNTFGSLNTAVQSHIWNSTAAITSVLFAPVAGTWEPGTSVSIYGIQ
jgi:hypothetical protein